MPGTARRLLSLTLCCTLALPSPALADQTGEQVIAGQATFDRGGHLLTIQQLTNRAIIGWEDFSIDPFQTVEFLQPAPDSAVLNRVLSGRRSRLLGTLLANGQVYLINPNGVIVGKDGVIDTAAFLASTLDVADGAFLAGEPLQFTGTSTAGVTTWARFEPPRAMRCSWPTPWPTRDRCWLPRGWRCWRRAAGAGRSQRAERRSRHAAAGSRRHSNCRGGRRRVLPRVGPE